MLEKKESKLLLTTTIFFNLQPASAKVPAPSPIKTYRLHMLPRDSSSPFG